MTEYDLNNMKRLHAMLLLKGKCIFADNILLKHIGAQNDIPHSTFYTTISTMLDTMIFSLLNMEYRLNFGEEYQNKIFDHLIHKAPDFSGVVDVDDQDGNDLKIIRALFIANSSKDYLENFKPMIDFHIGSLFLSFSVDVFSAFEFWIDKIYSEMILKYDPNEGKIKKAKKFVKRTLNDILTIRISEKKRIEKTSDNIMTKYNHYIEKIISAIKKEYMSYDSSHYKIHFVLNGLPKISKEDKKNIINTFEFLSTLRNSIHNLGINRSETKCMKFSNGEYIIMEKNKKVKSTNYICNILLFEDIFEVYRLIYIKYFDEFGDFSPLVEYK